jgi:hypothetical protein
MAVTSRVVFPDTRMRTRASRCEESTALFRGADSRREALMTNKEQGGGGHGQPEKDRLVEVHCDYLGADEPIKRKFPQAAKLVEVKLWARETFVPHPPSDKAYYLNDDKTRHRFTAEEEQKSLLALGYEHEAKLRLNEEQASG